MTEPSRVLMSGDWHGNSAWAHGVVRILPELLPDESLRLIVHCGDFGIWPGRAGKQFLHEVDRELDRVNGAVWFVDGNHDAPAPLAHAPMVDGRGQIRERIFHLPRGYRWTWHGRTWLALGGGISLDKAARIEGRSWWPQEEITFDQAERVSRGSGARA